jgi:ectoine hydroxylase-related dioxygenase (phytanoyl-CoA dioxygenase family)
MSENGRRDVDALATELERDGICTIPGLIPRDKIARWRDAYDALVAARVDAPGGLAPRGAGRHYVTLPWTEPFADPEVFANPTVLGVLNRVFAQEYVLVQLGADTAGPGSEYQEIHRDYRPLFDDTVVTPLYALAVNFPLVEVTPENGPFEMARGTHVLPRDEGIGKIEAGELPLEQFLAQPGDVTIRTPLALHRGTPNLTDEPRPVVVLGYAMHWLHTPKVEVNVPRATYEAWPPEIQQLLRCNVVDELRDGAETYVEFAF